jgi:glycosyltransferase involved in cell wall biosynthesis
MTTKEFAEQCVTENDSKACYIAIMWVDDQYDLEVEINEGSIGGVYRTDLTDLAAAIALADELDKNLTELGWRVFSKRTTWEKFCFALEKKKKFGIPSFPVQGDFS